MFDQVKALVAARMEKIGGEEEAPDYYAQHLNQSIWEMNDAWYSYQEAQEGVDGEAQALCLQKLSGEIGKVVCAAAAFGYAFGVPVEEAVKETLKGGDALRNENPYGLENDR